jgi:hypothetical protein
MEGSGLELIRRISDNHTADYLDVARIEPVEKHKFVIEYDWSINPCGIVTIHRLYMIKDYLNKGTETGYRRLNLRRIQEV